MEMEKHRLSRNKREEWESQTEEWRDCVVSFCLPLPFYLPDIGGQTIVTVFSYRCKGKHDCCLTRIRNNYPLWHTGFHLSFLSRLFFFWMFYLIFLV